jgi:hypothetical protein
MAVPTAIQKSRKESMKQLFSKSSDTSKNQKTKL